VIFERPRHQSLIIRQKRAGKGITNKALKRLTIEFEVENRFAVDQPFARDPHS
jgi:hypothetical protein